MRKCFREKFLWQLHFLPESVRFSNITPSQDFFLPSDSAVGHFKIKIMYKNIKTKKFNSDEWTKKCVQLLLWQPIRVDANPPSGCVISLCINARQTEQKKWRIFQIPAALMGQSHFKFENKKWREAAFPLTTAVDTTRAWPPHWCLHSKWLCAVRHGKQAYTEFRERFPKIHSSASARKL